MVMGVIFAFTMALGIWGLATETPEEKAEREERMALQEAEKKAEKAAKEKAKAKAKEEKRLVEERELAKKEAEKKARAAEKAKAEEEKRLAKEKEKAEKAKKEAEKAREDELNKYFSAWDGSNTELVNYVKANMNNPDSFEHVETLFKDHGDGFRIIMTFRGKNAFNGTVTHKVMARLNKETRELTEIEMIQ